VTCLIHHLALAGDWERARADGWYRTSTLGATVEQVGFLHACYPQQVAEVAERFYAGVAEPLVLLTIDPDLVSAPIVAEPVPPDGVVFPHVYGPLEVAAVVAVRPLTRDRQGRLDLP